jgi:hypothetical protein
MIRQILILSLLFLSACGGKEVDFGTFDLKKFKNDRGGCKGDRANMIEDFKEIKPKILGLSEREVVKYIGRYDFQVLDRRNEKIFVYYFDKGEHCQYMQNKSTSQSVALYFNSVSLVKEVTFQIGNPVE